MNFGMTLASLAALYLPSIVFGALLAWSYHKEPRQFRNAIWLLLFLPAFLSVALLNFGEGWGLLPIMMAVVFGPVIVVIFLLSNAVVVIRHEDLSLPTLLLALLVYSTLYRLLPRKRVYDYIIIHGAGFMPDGTPTPLLRGAHGGPFHHDHGESSFFEGDHGCAQRRANRFPGAVASPTVARWSPAITMCSEPANTRIRAEGGWDRQPYAWLLLAHGVHPGVHSRYQGAFVAVLCARPAGH